MLADRAVLRISGDDPRGFLQGLVTQDMDALSPTTPLYTALLTPQGKALFDFIMWDADGEAVLIDCEAGRAAALAQRLSIYRLRRAVVIEPLSDGRVHWAPDGCERVGGDKGVGGDEGVGGDRGVPDPRLAALGRRWIGDAGRPALGWHAHRLRLGVTEGVAELGDGSTLWLECNAHELRGVSFTKGCYVGQENTARMHHRAKVARRLAVAPLGLPNDRARANYPEFGLSVERRPVSDWGDALKPAWLVPALADQRPTDE